MKAEDHAECMGICFECVCDRVNIKDGLILKIWVIILNTQKRSQRPIVQDFVQNWIHVSFWICMLYYEFMVSWRRERPKRPRKLSSRVWKFIMKIHHENSSWNSSWKFFLNIHLEYSFWIFKRITHFTLNVHCVLICIWSDQKGCGYCHQGSAYVCWICNSFGFILFHLHRERSKRLKILLRDWVRVATCCSRSLLCCIGLCDILLRLPLPQFVFSCVHVLQRVVACCRGLCNML